MRSAIRWFRSAACSTGSPTGSTTAARASASRPSSRSATAASEPTPAVERLDEGDLAGALALSDAAGWNQVEDDWRVFIARGHAIGCRDEHGRLVATAAALPYGVRAGWIGMVLVDAGHRHRGLATRLMAECIDVLRRGGRTPVLDATPAGAPVYARLGFVAGFSFERWQGRGRGADAGAASSDGRRAGSGAASSRAACGDGARTSPVPGGETATSSRAPGGDGGARSIAAALAANVDDRADVARVIELDRAAARVDRGFLLAAFLGRAGTRAWFDGVGRNGFVVARAGRRATQVGPLVAAGGEGAALALLETALADVAGPVFIDVPSRWTALAAGLTQRGFERQRPFVRMALGPSELLEESERVFAVAGPEFG